MWALTDDSIPIYCHDLSAMTLKQFVASKAKLIWVTTFNLIFIPLHTIMGTLCM
jgi:hypothetical protein